MRANILLSIIVAMSALGEVKLIVLDPGHFHASLVQKDMYPQVDPTVSVYAPLGPDVVDYLNRVALFNIRKDKPTAWRIELHAGPDFFERTLRERPGNVVILAGRNREKIGRIEASVNAGLNVLADKPWIITRRDLPRLERVLDQAAKKNLIAYDIMTERFEITSILQKELVNDPEVFGTLIKGTESTPAVSARSIHHLMKVVAGVPLKRPVWFFDIAEYGDGLADVGTHVVDLVQWTAFARETIDYKKDISILNTRRWPTHISKADFERVTGVPQDGPLDYECNNEIHYTVRGAHVALDIRWNWESAGGDVYEAMFRGTKSRIELRGGELYVTATDPLVFAALGRKHFKVERRGDEGRIVIPPELNVGHEDHFAQVTNRFFEYLKAPATLPAWERSNMLVKYFITAGQ